MSSLGRNNALHPHRLRVDGLQVNMIGSPRSAAHHRGGMTDGGAVDTQWYWVTGEPVMWADGTPVKWTAKRTAQ